MFILKVLCTPEADLFFVRKIESKIKNFINENKLKIEEIQENCPFIVIKLCSIKTAYKIIGNFSGTHHEDILLTVTIDPPIHPQDDRRFFFENSETPVSTSASELKNSTLILKSEPRGLSSRVPASCTPSDEHIKYISLCNFFISSSKKVEDNELRDGSCFCQILLTANEMGIKFNKIFLNDLVRKYCLKICVFKFPTTSSSVILIFGEYRCIALGCEKIIENYNGNNDSENMQINILVPNNLAEIIQKTYFIKYSSKILDCGLCLNDAVIGNINYSGMKNISIIGKFCNIIAYLESVLHECLEYYIKYQTCANLIYLKYYHILMYSSFDINERNIYDMLTSSTFLNKFHINSITEFYSNGIPNINFYKSILSLPCKKTEDILRNFKLVTAVIGLKINLYHMLTLETDKNLTPFYVQNLGYYINVPSKICDESFKYEYSIFFKLKDYNKMTLQGIELFEAIRYMSSAKVTLVPVLYHHNIIDYSSDIIIGYNICIFSNAKDLWFTLLHIYCVYRHVVSKCDNRLTAKINVPSKAIKKIIGKKGVSVNTIESLCSVSISFSSESNNRSWVIVKGFFIPLQTAFYKIRKLLNPYAPPP